MNDLNILECSVLLGDVRAGRWSYLKPTISISERFVDWFYWVVDGLYPPTVFSSRRSRHQRKSGSGYSDGHRRRLERVRRENMRFYSVDGTFWLCHHDCGSEQTWEIS